MYGSVIMEEGVMMTNAYLGIGYHDYYPGFCPSQYWVQGQGQGRDHLLEDIL